MVANFLPSAPPAIGSDRSSQIVTTILTPVGTPGAKYPISQAGNNFYLVLATNTVSVKTDKGIENNYTQGTGLENPSDFKWVEIGNPTPYNIVVSIFVGFGGYIDNRLIVADPLVSSVTVLTYGVPNALNEVDVIDKTAQAIVDQNGNNFLALSRVAIYVSNLDTGVTYFIWNSAKTGSALAIAPAMNGVYGAGGNFVVAPNGVGLVNALVSEVYMAVRPTVS